MRFGFGTSGWDNGAVCYQPWSTNQTNSDYYSGGAYTNGLTGAYAEADWASRPSMGTTRTTCSSTPTTSTQRTTTVAISVSLYALFGITIRMLIVTDFAISHDREMRPCVIGEGPRFFW